MVDILKQSFAPITKEAWKAIEDQAKRNLGGLLSARKVVDFSGPHGWELAAVNTGRLDIPEEHKVNGVTWGTRKVLPLVEVRVPFFLSIMELDSVARGSKDPELAPLEEAAMNVARFEEDAIYHGFKGAGIQGILAASEHKPISLSKEPGASVSAVEDAVKTLQSEGIGGPYTLVLGTGTYVMLQKGTDYGFPLSERIKGLLRGGEILWSPALEGGALLSTRGGDFELTVGQDLSIGYTSHDREKVELYFTESFTFQVLEPRAAVKLKVGNK